MAGKEEQLSPVMEPKSKSLGSEAMGGCGLKRKAEETEEAAAAVDVVVRLESNHMVLIRKDSLEQEVVYSDESDSDEDPEVTYAKLKADFAAHSLELQARFPGVTYKDYSLEEDSHNDDKDVLGDGVAVPA